MHPFPVSRFISPWSFDFPRLIGWAGWGPRRRPVRTGESAIRTNQTLAFSETWRISTRSANMPSPLTSVPPWIGSAFSASTSAFVGVHKRQLYCFCMVRLFRVFLRPPVCTPGGIVKVCLGSCVFTHPRPQRWPHHATDREASTCVWRFPKWPGLETSHTACAAFQQSGPALRLEERGGEWGGGDLLAGPCNVFRSTDFWQHRSIWWRKMPAANESQQCLSNWTTTRKALCNWDTVNISKLSLNKLSVFIFSTLYLIFLKQFVIKGTALNVD